MMLEGEGRFPNRLYGGGWVGAGDDMQGGWMGAE